MVQVDGRVADIRTVNDLFLRVASSARPDALLWQDSSGTWLPISSDEIYGRVKALAGSLAEWGIQRGDRVAILSENRWEWQITDFAVLAIGAADVPIYPTLPAEQLGLLLRDSGARVIVVSTQAQLDKLTGVIEGSQLEHVVVMDEISGNVPGIAVQFSKLMAGTTSERDQKFDELVQSTQPTDLATLIYTSGTTGEPKGVMLSHSNIATNTSNSTREFDFGPTDGCISFLPLSHITARALDYVMFFWGAQVAYCPRFDQLPARMKEVRPTVFVGTPRVYEKIRQGVELKSAASKLKAWILSWGVKTGSAHSEAVHDRKRPDSLAWKVADKLVYTKIREAFGGRVRTFVSGGAPLGVDTGNWFASVGVSVLEGYGLTETSPVIAINSPVAHRMGSVGKALAVTECKTASDGELLVRGPGIFQGYWDKPAETAAVIDDEGYFATGDIAQIDSDGFVFITDRKKDLLKTSGGKLIAPQPIEGKFKNHRMVAEAAVIGDRHKFCCVLLSPNFAALESWAHQQGIGVGSRKDLVEDAKVLALYSDVLAVVNEGLARFETMKRFRLVPDEWTIDSGELTPSMKLKRRVIMAKYAGVIADLYADEATAHAGSV